MANTPNLDLVKPAGTDHALVSVINSNSDKIDAGYGTLSEQIATVDLGSVGSISALETALNTLSSNMNSNEFKNVKLDMGTSSSPFNSVRYIGTMSKTTNDRSQITLQMHNGQQIIHGIKGSPSWDWQEIVISATASSIPKFLYLGAPTLPVTLNVPSNSRTFLFVSGPYTNRGYGIVVVACNASGSVQPNVVGGNVLSATSSATNKVTIADTVGGTTSSAITAMTIYGDVPYIAT